MYKRVVCICACTRDHAFVYVCSSLNKKPKQQFIIPFVVIYFIRCYDMCEY